VEYLNQMTLKGDLVVEELKRVSTERDKFKEELVRTKESAQKAMDDLSNLRSQCKTMCPPENSGSNSSESPQKKEVIPATKAEDDPLGATIPSPSSSHESRPGSVTSISIVSPRSKPIETAVLHEENEGFFSYDEELLRMKTEVQECQLIIDKLQVEVKNLRGDLAVARESTQSMVQTLEESSRELLALQERKDRADMEYEEKQTSSAKLIDQLRLDLSLAEEKLANVEAEHRDCSPDMVKDLKSRLKKADQELANAQSENKLKCDGSTEVQQLTRTIKDMETEKKDLLHMQEEYKQCEKRINTLNGLVKNLRLQLSNAEESKTSVTTNLVKEQESCQDQILPQESEIGKSDNGVTESREKSTSHTAHSSEAKANDTSHTDGTSIGKKKNKRKKKGNKSAASVGNEIPANSGEEKSPKLVDDQESTQGTVFRLELEVSQLRVMLEEKESAIERLHGKLKVQEELSEEIETLRDDLVNLGQEHVEAKDRVKKLVAEKDLLQSTIQSMEQEIVDLRNYYDSAARGGEQKQKDLANNFEELKVKAATLQTDLMAAQQLASSRFKDLTEMKNILQRAQPELIALRSEVAGSRAVKEALGKREAELERLDTKHEEMQAEVTRLSQIVMERDTELKVLNQRIRDEVSSKLREEEKANKANQELQHMETEKHQATESLDQLSKELAKSQDELTASRIKLGDLEYQFSTMNQENESLKEEINLKTAQYASAQSLMSSMRDQTAEMAMQMKEARDRCESLEEELAEAHRLLGERSREGETMRRLLADVQHRADARTREMKERMDMAIEERDRAEEEASSAGRRKARELEELRSRLRESERSLKRVEEDKEELEKAQRDWKRRREELEHESARYTQESHEVRKAMGELQDALDQSERQARDLEKQNAELRRSVEETQLRLEKLQKSNKVSPGIRETGLASAVLTIIATRRP
jgi:chromosome segregation ATPase